MEVFDTDLEEPSVADGEPAADHKSRPARVHRGEPVLADIASRAAASLMTALPDEHEMLLQGALCEVLDITGDERARIHEFRDESRECLEVVCVVDKAPEDHELAESTLSTWQVPTWYEQLKAGKPVVVSDSSTLKSSLVAEKKYLDDREVTAALWLPLCSRGYVKGCLVLERYSGRGRWSEQLIKELGEFAEIVACSVEHCHTERHLERMVKENRDLNRRLVEIQEAERRRLAQELHDETGQYLVALRTDVSLVAKRAPEDDKVLRDAAIAVGESAGHIYEVVYSVMGRLCAVDLDDLGLEGGLRACLTNSRLESRGINCTLTLEGDLDSLEDMIQMSIYRVVQESLTNIAKYAEATRVDVSVKRLKRSIEDRRQRYRPDDESGGERPRIVLDQVEFFVADNGKGMEQGRVDGGGFGIRGMRERMQALGGKLEIDSAPGQGTRIVGQIHIAATPARDSGDA